MEAKILSVTQLKPQILKVVSMAKEAGQEYVVTKNGKPAAVIMSYEEWESWKETAEILSDPKAMARIRKNIAYFNRGGRGKTIEEVFGESD
ncbi:MAG TPA: type II toxin-antitoxin system Phd/YefM family antitoxin [bacterium]|nr:type II toxin-antitoxin system Phd/YefM family antitoxin [bacterium]